MTARWKTALSRIIPRPIWNTIRERKIIHKHAQTAAICHELIGNYLEAAPYPGGLPIIRKKDLKTEKIIWQYWSQGYDNLPEIIEQCLNSVDHWKGDYITIRLDDENVSDYLELPSSLIQKKGIMSKAHFSDILRLCLLYAYGGIWLDATIFMSGPIPTELTKGDFFVYQRDPKEPNKDYWKNTYSYYFGWADGFRVNMLNSIMHAKKAGTLVSTICGIMIYFWETNDTIPDYFFFQILFDVFIERYPQYQWTLVSDCKPHYLQQYLNDPAFNLATKEDILGSTSLHKLTYK